ncbi:LysE family translocator [Streptomyces oceani]|uniref:Lysine transporter LysE n=1 Tax=Streptomyces oceani TaxID=1075402 RepID=A0A1E7KHS3_9ACTN|nr:LysE family transporter [Streptomyces oceani]OEV03435.1 hypothetical protein AN216_11225 [Streptomyces oceani]
MISTAVLPLLGAWAVAVMSPGPDVVITLQTSAARTRRAGLYVATGVVTGIACWSLLALLGLTALLDRYQFLYQAVRVAGAVFLICYGASILWQTWRRRGADESRDARPAESPGGARPGPRADDAGPGPAVRGPVRYWRLGLLTNLANPKALVFFSALFASLLPAEAGGPERALILVLMLAMALAWFVVLALVAATPTVTGAYQRGQRLIDTLTGGVFAGVGVALMPR